MRPHVLVNLAASIDGKISDESRKQIRISCEQDLKRVDRLRSEADAIMVGIGTVLSDNPKLNIKDPALREKRTKELLKVVVDSRCRIPKDAEVLKGKTIVAVSKAADKKRVEEIAKLAEVVVFGEERVDLKTLMEHLWQKGVRKLLVEGGGTLINSLLREGLVDEIIIYYAPIFIGGERSPTICDGRSFEKPIKAKLLYVERFGDGFIVHLKLGSCF